MEKKRNGAVPRKDWDKADRLLFGTIGLLCDNIIYKAALVLAAIWLYVEFVRGLLRVM